MKNNTSLSRFEITTDEKITYANYHLDGKVINIDYVFAPEELRGKGSAGKLMAEICEYAKENNLKIFPICGYAKLWLTRHSKYHDLLK